MSVLQALSFQSLAIGLVFMPLGRADSCLLIPLGISKIWHAVHRRPQGQGKRKQAQVQLRVWGVACWLLDLPPVPQLTPFTFSIPWTFCQERKLQDLEVELTTRTKDVKARLAQLDVQVREGNG